jgi:hypothetical protein
MGLRSEIRLTEQAFRQRWEIKPEYKEAIIRRLMAIVASPESSNREVTAASKALMAAERHNQLDEQVSVVQSDRNRFLEIAERLGIREPVERTTSAGPGGGSGIVDAINTSTTTDRGSDPQADSAESSGRSADRVSSKSTASGELPSGPRTISPNL